MFEKPKAPHRGAVLLSFLSLIALLLGLWYPVVPISARAPNSTQIELVGPTGSGEFGRQVAALPNGHLVIADPSYDDGTTADVGATYLYEGSTGTLISVLTGTTAGDRVGSGSFIVLPNGNYLVLSPGWHNGEISTGAITWCSGETGCSGTVSAANSLVGSHEYDEIGSEPTVLAVEDYYVVRNKFWWNGENGNAGAVTWCKADTGCSGEISASNSLVGSTLGDVIGTKISINEDAYVVASPNWDNNGFANAGAVTWCSGATGCTGVITVTNSLVGDAADEYVGGLTLLPNGNYVVSSQTWNNGSITYAGAVTWCSGIVGCTGTISDTNSLVGSGPGDQVGNVTVLENGNYVVSSPYWNHDGLFDEGGTGAVSWCSAETGCKGEVSAANSLVGNIDGDTVGEDVTSLANGNYVVSSPAWDNSVIADAGAATWCDGTTGCTGVVSATNSLVGSTADDQVGRDIYALINGNYVAGNPYWDDGALADAGAVTWCDGSSGCTGAVSAANSLVGSTAGDQVGGVKTLANGNYVVISSEWDDGAQTNVGAVTWCSGVTGCAGAVSAANSLVGGTVDDKVGEGNVFALVNGSYVALSPGWDNGATVDAGAATWCDGTTGRTGVVSAGNSLVGSTAGDGGAWLWLEPLPNGNYVVQNDHWDNGAIVDAGAVTWCSGTAGCTGAVSAANSLVGSTAGDAVGNSEGGVVPLTNGNYVAKSLSWDNGGLADAGAVTWCSGTAGCIGVISDANSFVGSTANDMFGMVDPLANGHYVISNPLWDNGASVDVGAVTWGNGSAVITGTVTAENSVIGPIPFNWWQLPWPWIYDAANDQLVVQRWNVNIVTLFPNPHRTYSAYLPLVTK
jgi:hypothetical protein